jgi:hypothetical protein
MKLTKSQLKQLIKEEKRKILREDAEIMQDLLSLLGQAEGVASMNDPYDPDASGQEGQELALKLQSIWEAAGFDADEIFK